MLTRPPTPDSETARRVSVVIPVRDAGRTVERAIRSVLGQTHQDLEVLVVEDGSADASAAIVQRLAQEDVRVRSLRGRGGGPAGARNVGLEAARGRWIAFLDADDLWAPQKLERQLRFMEDRGIAASCTAYDLIDSNDAAVGISRSVPATIDRAALLRTCQVGCLTVMIDRWVLGDLRFPAVPKEDYALWFQVVERVGCFHGLNEIQAHYRRSTSTRSGNKLAEVPRQWRVYRDFLGLGTWESCWYLGHYAVHGLRKHLLST